MGVRAKTTERIVMDETGTYVVQSVRRVFEEQRYDNRLLRRVRGTPWEPNPGDVSTHLPEPMLIIPQLPDVEPTRPECTTVATKVHEMSIFARWTKRFGYTAGCRGCEVHRAGQSMSGQELTTECRRGLEDAMTNDTSTAARVKATRVRQAERMVKDLHESGSTNPSGSSGPSGSGQHKACSIFRPGTCGFEDLNAVPKCRLAARRRQ